MEFKGRRGDIALLESQLGRVADASGRSRGRAVIMTGRRRVGKSRLAEEFCDRAGVPYVAFQATRGRSPVRERADFADALAQSNVPGAGVVGGMEPRDWNQALRTLAMIVPEDRPSVAVIDEVPWLVEQDQEFEGALQTVWDQHLSAKPLLLLLIGSDFSVMEALQKRGRPFFGRAGRMTVHPLNVADVATITELDPAEAIDAYLITGGFPEVVQSWEPGMRRHEYLRESVRNPLSPLLVAGELSLLGEFPEAGVSRAVLEAVGSGERTFSAIAREAGGAEPLASGTLSPVLKTLLDRHVLAVDYPLSTASDTKNKRYRVADPYLRFWLAFLRRGLPLAERGRGDLVLERIARSWPAWRGRAIEPLIRHSLLRLLPDRQWLSTEAVGGWWNRRNNPEIDLVGADREQAAKNVHFVGSIKWLDNRPFGRRDYDTLVRDMLAVPGTGADTPAVAVSRSGLAEELPLAAHWGPDDIVNAWEPENSANTGSK